MKNVLVIQGGGLFGLLFIQHMKKLKIDLNSFDLIAGTSTGSLLAYSISCGFTYEEMEQFYIKQGKEIFSNSLWYKLYSANGLVKAKYETLKLDKVVKQVFKDRIPKINMFCNTYNLEQDSPQYFKTYKNDDLQNGIIASSCAMTFFKPHVINKERFVDGGADCNSLVMSAYVEAKKLYPNENIRVVRVGTEGKTSYPKELDGLNSWIPNIVNLFMSSNSNSQEYILQKSMSDNDIFEKINVPLINCGIDDIERIVKEYYKRESV